MASKSEHSSTSEKKVEGQKGVNFGAGRQRQGARPERLCQQP